MLDSWRMWGARVDFDVRRMELGKAFGEDRVMEEDLGTSKGICPVYVVSDKVKRESF